MQTKSYFNKLVTLRQLWEIHLYKSEQQPITVKWEVIGCSSDLYDQVIFLLLPDINQIFRNDFVCIHYQPREI